MSRIRVLVVEQSSVTRETIRQVLGSDPDLEVLLVTGSNLVAISKAQELNPAAVVLDITEPDKTGLKTLAQLRQSHPNLPIIIFSNLTSRGSQTTIDSILAGATDYVTRPEIAADVKQAIQNDLITKIKQHAARNLAHAGKAANASEAISSKSRDSSITTAAPVRNRETPAEIIAIATSTGGPSALATLLSELPASFTTPIVVVQHMGAGFTSGLADSLRRQTGRNVREVDAAHDLGNADVWIATGGRHLVLQRKGVSTLVMPNDDPPENDCRPSADVLFRSVVSLFGRQCLAVVLTGMGCDGVAGCRAIRQAGGSVLVQDEASSVSWGMPGQVASAGLADMVLPLQELSREICLRTNPRRGTHR